MTDIIQSTTPNFTVERKSKCIVVSQPLEVGEVQHYLVRADAHHDSPYANVKLEKELLDEALERKALIFDVGDCFDAMQGTNDRRSSNKGKIKALQDRDDYWNALVENAAEFYRPYAKNWVMFSQGNHESSILKHNEVDITKMLVEKLRAEDGSQVLAGGYGGYVKLRFTVGGTSRFAKTIKYFHGTGGAAPVTLGMIQTQRQQADHGLVDVFWGGHNHNYFNCIRPERVLLPSCKEVVKQVRHMNIPSTKETGGAFDIQMNMLKAVGAYWLRVKAYPRCVKMSVEEVYS